jgi:hypothetical protein
VFSQLEAILLIHKASVGRAWGNKLEISYKIPLIGYAVYAILRRVIVVHIVQIGRQEHDERHQREFVAHNRDQGGPNGAGSEDPAPGNRPVDSLLAHVLGGVGHRDKAVHFRVKKQSLFLKNAHDNSAEEIQFCLLGLSAPTTM